LKCPKCETENSQDSRFCKACAAPLPAPHASGSSLPTETLQTPASQMATGSTLAGRYQVIEELGHGGMGRVYKVFDTDIKEKIALKLLRPEIAMDKETVERFSNELKLARKISHRNVCRMFDLGRAEGATFITMEFVAGEDLKRLIRKTGQLGAGRAVAIAKQVAEGLAEAHRLGITHRDLKPQNIMVDEEGNVRIMDFGIARSMKTAGLTGAGVIIGTPEYMSPEQVEAKEVDQRSDIYSLGVILYEMVTGRVPFEADTPFAVGVKHKSEIPRDPRELNSHIPEDLSRVILKCLEKDKAARYESADALRADLARIEGSLPTTEKSVPKRKGVTTRQITVTFNARKLVVPVVGVLAVIAAAVILWRVFGARKPVPVAASGRPSIAVMYFENQTDKPGLDRMLVTLLTTNLSRFKNIEVTSTQRLFDILKLLGKQDAQTIDRSLATEVATRAGVRTMLLGSVIRIGEQIRLTSELIDVKSGSIIATQTEDGAKYDDIFGMVDRITEQVGQEIGGSRGKGPLKVADVTTSSLEALDYYQKGYDQMMRFNISEAREFFRKATEIDPKFAMAYAYLAFLVSGVSAEFNPYRDQTEAKKYIELAKENSARVADTEQLMILSLEADIYWDFPKAAAFASELLSRGVPEKFAYLTVIVDRWHSRDFRGAVQTAEKGLEADPADGNLYNMLAYSYGSLNDFANAISAARKYIAVLPDVANAYDTAWEISILAGQYGEALKYADDAMRTHPAWTAFDYRAGLALIYQGKIEEARQRFNHLAQNRPDWRTDAMGYIAGTYVCEGRYREARDELLKALEWSRKNNETLGEILGYFRLGEALLIQGSVPEAIAQFKEAEKGSGKYYKGDFNPIPVVSRFYIGRALVRERQFDRAGAAAQEIRSIIADKKMASQFHYFDHLLEAEIALAQNRGADALRELGREGYDAEVASPFYWQIRASAEEALGRLDAASESYGKFLRCVGLARAALGDPVRYFYELSMVDYNLGRISERAGDAAAAKDHYRKFLDGMKSADPGVPEVGEARTRLAALGETARSSN
jgi:tetratricopeptide (TPR) repeat protein/tRNA A-37 threonylcarbamoyl transferase component Bud32